MQRLGYWNDAHVAVAQRWGLVVDDGLHIHGVIDRIPIAITRSQHAEMGEKGEDAIYSALLPSAAPLWFSVAEKALHEKMGAFFRGLVHKPAGEDAFDTRFAIHAPDPVAVAAMFDEDARAALFQLADAHLHPLLTAQMLSVRQFLGYNIATEAGVELALRSLVTSAQVLVRTFQVASMGGGYR